MCGIFGVVINENSNLDPNHHVKIFENLFELSESRGKEASGLAVLTNKKIFIYKEPKPASFLIHSSSYRQILADIGLIGVTNHPLKQTLVTIGHARLVTNGAMEVNYNNQPVVKDGLVGIHNGIIVNDNQLWAAYPALMKNYNVDTEVILSLLRSFFHQEKSLAAATRKTFRIIKGSASVAVLFEDLGQMLLATNTGSLYVYQNQEKGFIIFASELYILQKLAIKFPEFLDKNSIFQIKAGQAYIIDLNNLIMKRFLLSAESEKGSVINDYALNDSKRKIIDLSTKDTIASTPFNTENFNFLIKKLENFSYQNQEKINLLKRCTKCILPETFPLIEFDEQGVCNYCRNYKPDEVKGTDELIKIVERYRHQDNRPNCVFPFSGGRDSSYGLHYAKKVLNLNPVTYSYDWGMITDVGRRNQARMCGQLGVEHILISADIRQKRANIRKNVLAWLRKPVLGMIPLFMAGDKQYFFYANQLRKRLGVEAIIMCENSLERTNFKHGFCGVEHARSDVSQYFMSLGHKMKLARYYGQQFFINPAYFNSSMFDAIGGFISYFFIPHNYLYLYQFIKWDEHEVMSTLENEYDWEFAGDKKISWRNDDGTAPFYNYIYYTVAGFTENDTFRSNQIREGAISRERAWQLAREENQPRYDPIKWYCDTISLDLEKTLMTINAMPKLYNRHQK